MCKALDFHLILMFYWTKTFAGCKSLVATCITPVAFPEVPDALLDKRLTKTN